MSEGSFSSHLLLLTERGECWTNNFEEADRPLARELAASLTLVSHNEFERSLSSLIYDTAKKIDGIIALYGARELEESLRFEALRKIDSIDATPRGTNIGSEGRVANIIRNISLSHPEKYLNHPTVDKLRTKKAHAIFLIDDFIGSGKRCTDYLDFLWRSRSLRSWTSYKRIIFFVIAYTGTTSGIKTTQRHPANPAVQISRHCPTINSLHWKHLKIEAARKLCFKYSSLASFNMPLGFRNSASLLIFEHGCPNNTPQIFWATSKKIKDWAPLFFAKRIDEEVATLFPPELINKDPVHVLMEAGQNRLAAAISSNAHRPLTNQEALTLALFSKGKSRVETIATANGLRAKEATELIERCISAGWISPRKRITDKGLAELRGIRSSLVRRAPPLPALGTDEYYPKALRSHGNG